MTVDVAIDLAADSLSQLLSHSGLPGKLADTDESYLRNGPVRLLSDDGRDAIEMTCYYVRTGSIQTSSNGSSTNRIKVFSAVRADDLSGQEFDGYRIVEKIGYGGMAFVYRAVQIRLNRQCALKILRPELAEDERFVRRFLQEAQSAANLNHPNIVTIYDTGEIDGYYFIAMEYLTGQPLQELLSSGQLDLVSVVDIVAQTSSALDYAHSQGIVHRDIKPGNMIVSETGWLTLTDFGIARLSGATRLTTTGTMLGTPVYMAPEQIQGEPATAQTDIYQLGITVYEMLTGTPPFEGETPQAVFYSHFQEAPQPIHERVEYLGPEVDTVVNRALKKVPADRYHTASDLAIDLAQAVEQSDATIQLHGQITSMAPVRRTPSGPETTPAPLAIPKAGDLEAVNGEPGRRRIWIAGGAVALVAILAAVITGIFLMQDDGGGQASSSEPTSAPISEPTVAPASREVPARGNIIFDQPFEFWLDQRPEGGFTTFDEGGFIIGVEVEDHTIAERSTEGVLIDGSVSVEIQMRDESEGEQEGCLLARVDTSNAFRYAYSLCINARDETFAMYEIFHDDGSVETTMLAPVDRRLGTRPAQSGNLLEIVTRQNMLWFLVNEQVIGSVIHDADQAGVIGVSVHNTSGGPAVFAFNSLEIREIL